MILVLFILLFVSVFLGGTITSLPLALICLLCFLIVKKSRMIFYGAFLAGLALDILKVHMLGSESLFFLAFLYLVILYKKKYEINSYPFVVVSAFLGSFLFGFIFGSANPIVDAGISSIIALVLFSTLQLSQKLKLKI